ncbi:MAG: ribonuclease catalytic domain-containing protein [Thermodesulfobacteriota bacterium]
MEIGQIVEYIEKQKMICAVVLEMKNQRVRALNETNREVNLSFSRLSFKGKERLSLALSRDKLVEALKETSARRKQLAASVDIKGLWEILNTEEEWVELETMTSFCFGDEFSSDQQSAVIRAFFSDRTYFKFDHNRFFPNSREKVDQLLAEAAEIERKERLIATGGDWLKRAAAGAEVVMTAETAAFIEILKSYYLFEKESLEFETGKGMLARAGMDGGSNLFKLMVRLGIWDRDENIDLLRSGIAVDFADAVLAETEEKVRSVTVSPTDPLRRDLSRLPIMTIDGSSTQDFDDALSVEKQEDGYVVGIHIVDVGHYIQKGDILDQEAMGRGSSIYMPDLRISMLPSILAENYCSLRAGENRPAISILVKVDRFANRLGYEIFPSIIRVHRQLTYSQADDLAGTDEALQTLHMLAGHFRQKRIAAGAIQLILPEISIQLGQNGHPDVVRLDRESPGRMLVAEMMIMANWVMAGFLHQHRMAAIFRSQPAPKNRIIRDNEGTFFQNCMQRKQLSRVVLSMEPEHHTGLGLEAYVTATSPIRKYSDLVTQRQVRAALGLETPYGTEEMQQIVQALEMPLQSVSRLQIQRQRYWLLRHLEGRIGQKEEAVVLEKRRDGYVVMLPHYMLECKIPIPGGTSMKPGDLAQVTVQHVNARADMLSLYLG